MFPWLVFLKRSGKRLSDIEYLAIKEFDGKLTTGEGTLSAAGDLVKITAAGGKDMYLGKAKVSARIEAATNVVTAIIELQAGADGSETTKATWSCELISATASGHGGSSVASYEFVVSGIKVTTGQVIQLVATTVDGSIEVNGELVVFEEDTGASPAV